MRRMVTMYTLRDQYAEKPKRKKERGKQKEGPSKDVVEFMKKKTESFEEARVQGEEIIRLEKEKLQLEQLDREKIMDVERNRLHLQKVGMGREDGY
jgi:hypothetical protein